MSDLEKQKLSLASVFGLMAILLPALYWLIAGNIAAASAEKRNDEQDQRFDSQTVILMDIKNDLTAIKTELKLRRR